MATSVRRSSTSETLQQLLAQCEASRLTDPQQGCEFAKKLLAMAKRAKEELLMAKAYEYLAIFVLSIGDTRKVMIQLDGAIELYRSLGEQNSLGIALVRKGEYLRSETELEAAAHVFEEAAFIIKETNDPVFLATFYVWYGNFLNYTGQPVEAFAS